MLKLYSEMQLEREAKYIRPSERKKAHSCLQYLETVNVEPTDANSLTSLQTQCAMVWTEREKARSCLQYLETFNVEPTDANSLTSLQAQCAMVRAERRAEAAQAAERKAEAAQAADREKAHSYLQYLETVNVEPTDANSLTSLQTQCAMVWTEREKARPCLQYLESVNVEPTDANSLTSLQAQCAMVRAERKAEAAARRPLKATRKNNRYEAMKIALGVMPVISKLLARVESALEFDASIRQSIACSRVRPPHFVPRLTLRVSSAATNAKSVLRW